MERIEHTKSMRLGSIYFCDIEDNDCTYLGKMLGAHVYSEQSAFDKTLLWVYLVDRKLDRDKKNRRGQKIAELTLSHTKGKAYCVDMSAVDVRYQGHGVMPKLYAFVVYQLGIYLEAGSMQSPGGRKIWVELNKSSIVEVLGRTRTGKKVYYMEENDDGDELVACSPRVKAYDTDRDFIMYCGPKAIPGGKNVSSRGA